MMLNSAGQWYFNPDGSLNLVGNPTFKAALDVYQKLWTNGLAKPVSGWTDFTGSFTGGDVAAVPIGVWIVGTIKANAAADAGKWAVAPVPRLDTEGSANASNWGGSSWYVLASSPAEEKAAAIDFLKTDLGRRRRLLPEDPRRPGRRRHAGSQAREGEAYQSSDDFFGGQPVWQNFSTWLAAGSGRRLRHLHLRGRLRDLRAAADDRPGRRPRRCHRGDQRAGAAGNSVRFRRKREKSRFLLPARPGIVGPGSAFAMS